MGLHMLITGVTGMVVTMAAAVLRRNPRATFCYVSGAGTDTSERGRSMWARVKGRTERTVLEMGFGRAYAMRPGYLHPVPGQRNLPRFHRAGSWLYPVLRLVPRFACGLDDLALAMLEVTLHGDAPARIEVPQLRQLAERWRGRR